MRGTLCGGDNNMWSYTFHPTLSCRKNLFQLPSSYIYHRLHFYLMRCMPIMYLNLINISHEAFDHNININNIFLVICCCWQTDLKPWLNPWTHLTLVCHELEERLIGDGIINRKKAGQTRSIPLARWHFYEPFLKLAACFMHLFAELPKHIKSSSDNIKAWQDSMCHLFSQLVMK